MKYIECDMCGERDHWGDPPFFQDGVVLSFRGSSGADRFDYEKEICEGCKVKLLAKFPKLKQATT